MTDLSIPRFLAPPAAPVRHTNVPTPARVVAAIRWDYEVGLLSMAECCRRYGSLLAASTVRDICAGRIHPDVKASRFVLNWR